MGESLFFVKLEGFSERFAEYHGKLPASKRLDELGAEAMRALLACVGLTSERMERDQLAWAETEITGKTEVAVTPGTPIRVLTHWKSWNPGLIYYHQVLEVEGEQVHIRVSNLELRDLSDRKLQRPWFPMRIWPRLGYHRPFIRHLMRGVLNLLSRYHQSVRIFKEAFLSKEGTDEEPFWWRSDHGIPPLQTARDFIASEPVVIGLSNRLFELQQQRGELKSDQILQMIRSIESYFIIPDLQSMGGGALSSSRGTVLRRGKYVFGVQNAPLRGAWRLWEELQPQLQLLRQNASEGQLWEDGELRYQLSMLEEDLGRRSLDPAAKGYAPRVTEVIQMLPLELPAAVNAIGRLLEQIPIFQNDSEVMRQAIRADIQLVKLALDRAHTL